MTERRPRGRAGPFRPHARALERATSRRLLRNGERRIPGRGPPSLRDLTEIDKVGRARVEPFLGSPDRQGRVRDEGADDLLPTLRPRPVLLGHSENAHGGIGGVTDGRQPLIAAIGGRVAASHGGRAVRGRPENCLVGPERGNELPA